MKTVHASSVARTVKLALAAAAAAVPLAASAAGCGGGDPEVLPRKGQIILAVTTDMAIPKDLDQIRVEVIYLGSAELSQDYALGPTGVKLPATLAIVASDEPSQAVTIRVYSKRANQVRAVRQVVTTVPQARLATLRMNLDWLCDGKVDLSTPSLPRSACPDGQTCSAGLCVSSDIDSGTLPDYSDASVFGGARVANGQVIGGSCFDTLGCFAEGAETVIDPVSCSIPMQTGARAGQFNVALRPDVADGDTPTGICGDGGCLVPLDGDFDSGWGSLLPSLGTDRVALPKGVCASGKAFKVLTTTECRTKTASTPTCGAWSSVTTPGTNAPEVDAGVATSDASVPSITGKVVCPDELQSCAAGASVGCCWESADQLPDYACKEKTACTGLFNTCDGNNDCTAEGARVCCFDVTAGGSCRGSCDTAKEGERCDPRAAQGAPGSCAQGKICKNCATSLRVTVPEGVGLVSVPICAPVNDAGTGVCPALPQ